MTTPTTTTDMQAPPHGHLLHDQSHDQLSYNHIEQLAVQQALAIRANPAQRGFTYMRYISSAGNYACEMCTLPSVRLCTFVDDFESQTYFLCEQHVRRCQTLQSEILTNDVIALRLRLIGPSYTTLCQFANYTRCLVCYGHRAYGYSKLRLSGVICSPCKQESEYQYILIVFLLSAIPDVDLIADIRAYITSLLYSLANVH